MFDYSLWSVLCALLFHVLLFRLLREISLFSRYMESSEGSGSQQCDFCDKRKRLEENGEMNMDTGRRSLQSRVKTSTGANCDGLCVADDEAFFTIDLSNDSHYGILKVSDSVVYLFAGSTTFIVNMVTRSMIVSYDSKRILPSHGMECIDLDTNGRRWEGGVKDGKPFGYGVVYDEEGRKEYEGFMLDGIKTCYGIEFYSDIGRVKYDGCFCDNNRFGKGTLCDRNGTVEHSGLWKNNHPCSSIFDGRTIDNYTELVKIPNCSFSDTCSFTPSFHIHSLKRIVMGDECFVSALRFELEELDGLESIIIGERCFTTVEDIDVIDNRERTDGVFRVVNCPKLKFIQIGDWSFRDYHSFELSSLPSLESIDIGEKCFYYAPSFSLTGLIDWLV